MRRQTRVSGFTLVELIVVITIMGVSATIGTVMFVRMTTVWSQTKARAELDARADHAFEVIREDVSNMASALLTGSGASGTDGTAQDDRFWRIALTDDTLVLPVRLPIRDEARTGLGMVTYRINRGEEVSSLVREQVQEWVVAEGVVQMCVEYADEEGKWHDKPAGMAPTAVRVSLTLVKPSQPSIQVSRKAVFPINVS